MELASILSSLVEAGKLDPDDLKRFPYLAIWHHGGNSTAVACASLHDLRERWRSLTGEELSDYDVLVVEIAG